MLIRQSFYKTLESLSTVSLSIPMDLACGRLQQIVVASATAWELFWSNLYNTLPFQSKTTLSLSYSTAASLLPASGLDQ